MTIIKWDLFCNGARCVTNAFFGSNGKHKKSQRKIMVALDGNNIHTLFLSIKALLMFYKRTKMKHWSMQKNLKICIIKSMDPWKKRSSMTEQDNLSLLQILSKDLVKLLPIWTSHKFQISTMNPSSIGNSKPAYTQSYKNRRWIFGKI